MKFSKHFRTVKQLFNAWMNPGAPLCHLQATSNTGTKNVILIAMYSPSTLPFLRWYQNLHYFYLCSLSDRQAFILVLCTCCVVRLFVCATVFRYLIRNLFLLTTSWFFQWKKEKKNLLFISYHPRDPEQERARWMDGWIVVCLTPTPAPAPAPTPNQTLTTAPAPSVQGVCGGTRWPLPEIGVWRGRREWGGKTR